MKKKNLIIFFSLLLIIVVILLIINLTQKPAQNTTQITITPTQAVIYDGIYKGNTGIAGGLADVTLTVSGIHLTGTATYKGVVSGSSISLPATISGTVTATGLIDGTVAVQGRQYNMNISLTGPTNGQITQNIMSCTYTVSGDFGTFNGEISLTKD